jgi:glycosyltransferase involved in cell wall biosynthesis
MPHMKPERRKRLLFIAKGRDDAATRYRCTQYFPDWEGRGWQPVLASAKDGLWAKMRLLAMARQSDAVFVNRKMFPPFFTRLLRRASPVLIFDFDDALFAHSDGSFSATRRTRFAAMLRASDLVFAGNDYLATEARQYNANVQVIPTAVDSARYTPAAQGDDPPCLDLVWIGSRSTRKYLEAILPFLEQAAAVVPGLRLKIVSNFTLPGERLPIDSEPWREETEAGALASSHIGIAPLWDDPWTRGKCALKVLQYMAAGLPVVSSAVGANAEAVEDGVSGLLVANTSEAWVRALRVLAEDGALRRRMGEHGRRIVEERYDKSVVFDRMAAALPIQGCCDFHVNRGTP